MMQRLILHGEALLVMEETVCEAVKRRIAAFIAAECAKHDIQDKTSAFMAP